MRIFMKKFANPDLSGFHRSFTHADYSHLCRLILLEGLERFAHGLALGFRLISSGADSWDCLRGWAFFKAMKMPRKVKRRGRQHQNNRHKDLIPYHPYSSQGNCFRSQRE